MISKFKRCCLILNYSICFVIDLDRAIESLFIMTWTGLLTEYVLEPHPKAGLDKLSEESPLEMTETPRAQWSLGRSAFTFLIIFFTCDFYVICHFLGF